MKRKNVEVGQRVIGNREQRRRTLAVFWHIPAGVWPQTSRISSTEDCTSVKAEPCSCVGGLADIQAALDK